MKLNKLFKKTYVFICNIYSGIITIINNIYLKQDPKIILKKDFLKYDKKQSISKLLNNLAFNEVNENFQKIFLIEEEGLNHLIKFIFTSEFKQYLIKNTGFKYSIDYLFIYKNKFLSKDLENKSIYANKPHFDKPFSKNMLKLIIPVDLIDKNEGPLMVFDRNTNSLNNEDKNNFKAFLSPNNGTSIYCFNPRKTLHFAAPPKKEFSSLHIMMQLNPSKKWSIDNDIIENQLYVEPNFPEIRNLFKGKTIL